ncbi:MAG: sortase [Oscillospiraceae bacterium]|nr:sortase [Oscillospiraceae bacterium]
MDGKNNPGTLDISALIAQREAQAKKRVAELLEENKKSVTRSPETFPRQPKPAGADRQGQGPRKLTADDTGFAQTGAVPQPQAPVQYPIVQVPVPQPMMQTAVPQPVAPPEPVKDMEPDDGKTSAGAHSPAAVPPAPLKDSFEEFAASASDDADGNDVKQALIDSLSDIPEIADNFEDISKKRLIKLIFYIFLGLNAVIIIFLLFYFVLGEGSKRGGPAEAYVPQDEQQDYVNAEDLVSSNAAFVDSLVYNVPEGTDFPVGIQGKYKAAYAASSDFAGYITVPGTAIDRAVHKYKNNDYYLEHDPFYAYTQYGTPFIDMDCSLEPLSRNSVIYGHNFSDKNDFIFGELEQYENLDFYKSSPVITFNTVYRDYKWKIIAAFRTNGSSGGDNGYLFDYICPEMNDESFAAFINEVMQRSYIHTGVDVIPSDKVLTLSTCTHIYNRNGVKQDVRFVVMARLVRDGESETVDTSLAVKNDNVRYPQFYYTLHGLSNPYAKAEKWFPQA